MVVYHFLSIRFRSQSHQQQKQTCDQHWRKRHCRKRNFVWTTVPVVSKADGIYSSGNIKTAVLIIHRILIRVPFNQIKRQTSAFLLLTEHNSKLTREHMWDEQEWDVQQLGLFVAGYNPKYYSAERVTTSVWARLCEAMPRLKVPKFQMILRTHKIIHQDRTSSTQAYTFKVPTTQYYLNFFPPSSRTSALRIPRNTLHFKCNIESKKLSKGWLVTKTIFLPTSVWKWSILT